MRPSPPFAGQQAGLAGRPCALLPEHDQEAAAALDEPLEHAAGHPLRDDHVVEDDDRVRIDRRRGHACRGQDLHVKCRRVADAERPREIETRVAAIAAVDDEHGDGGARGEHEMERIVGRKNVGAGAHDAAHHRVCQGELVERDRPRRWGRSSAPAFRSRGLTSSRPDRHSRVGARFVTPAVTVMRSWPENEARAKVTDGTERFAVLPVAIGTGVSVIPSPKWTSSPAQPARWKSR